MLNKWQKLINEIYWTNKFNLDKVTIKQLKELADFVKTYLKAKWKSIEIKYWDEVMSWKKNKRLQVQWCFHWLQSKTLWNFLIEDSAWIRTEDWEDSLEDFSKPIIDFLEDLKDIKDLVREKSVNKWPYWGKNW